MNGKIDNIKNLKKFFILFDLYMNNPLIISMVNLKYIVYIKKRNVILLHY